MKPYFRLPVLKRLPADTYRYLLRRLYPFRFLILGLHDLALIAGCMMWVENGNLPLMSF
jgi:hypothetical protein